MFGSRSGEGKVERGLLQRTPCRMCPGRDQSRLSLVELRPVVAGPESWVTLVRAVRFIEVSGAHR